MLTLRDTQTCLLYCYGGKEYFDSSIEVLFDIFPLLMGDEHEIYIYVYYF